MKELSDRDLMYKLIVSQLFYDGLQKFALPLAAAWGMGGNMPPPSDKLFRWLGMARKLAEENGELLLHSSPDSTVRQTRRLRHAVARGRRGARHVSGHGG